MRAGERLAGRYRLDARLGQGGIGEVWRGFDADLGRPVAVKVLLEFDASDELLGRFRREAAIGARLQHPGITVVHDIGQHENRLFIVMELLEGEDLAHRLARSPGTGLPVPEALDLALQAAEALAAAHAQKVVHRDLKPANLFLLTTGGRLKICDFGIARTADSTGGLTVTGRVFGTPAYMAPEQWRGEHVDARCDLYALGCVLFALLTGAPPFPQADQVWVLMRRHLDEAPPALDSVRPDLPPALVELVAALLSKDPAERPDAQNTTTRLRTLLAAAAAPAQAPATAPAPQAPAPEPAAAPAADRMAARARALAAAPEPTPTATQETGTVPAAVPVRPGGLDAHVPAAYRATPPPPPPTVPATDPRPGTSRRRLLLGGVGLVAGAWGGVSLVRRFTEADDSAPGLELLSVLSQPSSSVESVAFSHDGSTLAAAGRGNAVWLWSVSTKALAGTLKHDTPIRSLAFSPDGKTIATGGEDRVVQLWDVAKGTRTGLTDHTGRVRSVAFSPDAKWLASAGDDSGIRLWDLGTGRPAATLTGHAGGVTSLAFSPDGAALASGGSDRSLRLWNVAGPTTAPGRSFTNQQNEVTSVAFSPDGHTVAGSIAGAYGSVGTSNGIYPGAGPDPASAEPTAGIWGAIDVWDAAQGTRTALHANKTATVSSLTFRPDGKTIACGGWDNAVHLWDVGTERTSRTKGHTAPVWSVAFSPDGKLLASASGDGTVRLWKVS
ncbi:WD40 repeat domain-containing serine/threonine protein kinase [Streptomyces sp. NPDC001594]|uniref:WD40 repeat domain-containing serine/threonine protein kinase n=1 Tax=Streptomyces sp. NPDC001594 TaxID=3364590 RepID=UPI0036767387